MKKIILLAAAIIGMSVYCNAQCNLPYKPLSAFDSDTTAFIIYNFMDRKDCYKGKTLKEVTSDLNIPVKYYLENIMMRGSHFGGLYLFRYDDVSVTTMIHNKKEHNAIFLYWETPVNVLDPQYKKFSQLDWDKGYYDYVKDMRIKEIGVVIPKSSKYYEKYKPKELKSQEDPYVRKKWDW